MILWKKMPLVRLVLPFILGLFFSIELNLNFGLLGLFILLYGIIFIHLNKNKSSAYKRNHLFAIVVSVVFFSLGGLRGELYENEISNAQLTKEDLRISEAFVLDLKGEFIEKANSYKIEAEIVGVYQKGELLAHTESTLLYIPKTLISDSLKQAGQIIALSSPNEIQHPKNPNEFNYKKYLSGLGINYQFYLDSTQIRISRSDKERHFMDYFVNLRKFSLEKLQGLGISKKSFSVISALVFGQKDFLSPDLYDAYGSAGATHVLAVSGLHVGLIYIILTWMCRSLKRFKIGRILSVVLILLVLWSYAAITGLSPSVLRASTMFTFITIASYSKRNSNIYNTIAASALGLLVVFPNLLMEVGFQLSYSAVLGILIIQPFLYKLYSPNSYLLDKAWQITSVSISAQLGTFPLGMLYFHQFPNYFMLSNLFVIPLATLILYLTLITLLASFLPFIGQLLGLVLDYTVRFLNLAIDKMTLLPYARSEGIDISVVECFLLYGIILQFIIVFIQKRYSSIKWTVSLLIMFFALQCWETYEQQTQKSCTIHIIKNERVLSIVEGKTCFFICSEKLLNDPDKIKFHISHYWDHLGIEEIINIRIDENYSCSTFTKTRNSVLYNNYVILLNSRLDFNSTFGNDQIVLLNEVEKNSSFEPDRVYYADGFTKKKYLLNRTENKQIEPLEYALILK